MKYSNFTIYPSQFASLFSGSKEIIGYGKVLNMVSRTFNSLTFISAVPISMFLVCLTLSDSLNMWNVGASVVPIGLSATGYYLLQKEMTIPLWSSKLCLGLATLSIFCLMLLNFKVLDNSNKYHTQRLTFSNINQELTK